MEPKGRVLLVNPWIYDFAAHNLWIEPLGLLTIAAVLRDNGYWVTTIDCLGPHRGMPRRRPDGTGKFSKVLLDKPPPVEFVPRHYGRYGLPVAEFDAALDSVLEPDLVLVASGMTYWYPGVVEAIRRIRARFQSVPVALGGVYASLCPDHAREHSGAGRILSGPATVVALRLADDVTGNDSNADRYAHPRAWPAPAHDLVPRSYAAIVTSWGCPFRCTYCASSRLQPAYAQREPRAVVTEIVECTRRGIRDFAFYDDALLIDAQVHIVPILQEVLARGLSIRLHTPNGLHAGPITPELARLMRLAGFAAICLSLETTDVSRQEATGGKVTTGAFLRAVAHLKAAGFRPGEIAAYILAGLPDQPLSEVEDSVRFVHRHGVLARLALFSPIPGTPEGDRALPTDADPLLHNNTVYPYLLGDDYVCGLQGIKQVATDGNAKILNCTGQSQNPQVCLPSR
jgi:radical SAM superfamily enzyme YgiQ (UPF0313 family)